MYVLSSLFPHQALKAAPLSATKEVLSIHSKGLALSALQKPPCGFRQCWQFLPTLKAQGSHVRRCLQQLGYWPPQGWRPGGLSGSLRSAQSCHQLTLVVSGFDFFRGEIDSNSVQPLWSSFHLHDSAEVARIKVSIIFFPHGNRMKAPVVIPHRLRLELSGSVSV